MKKKIVTFTSLLFLLLTISVKAQDCRADKDGYEIVPCSHERITIIGGIYKQLRGKVTDPLEESVEFAIVSLHKISKQKSIFIGSQKVNKEGRYCFKNLPKGKYVLKVGASAFKCTDVEFEIDPKNKKSLKEELIVVLEIAT